MKYRLIRPMLCAIFSISFLLFCTAGFAENIDPDDNGSQHAWGENVGWLNLEPGGDGGPGVEVADDELTGYMWGENIGWISLSCLNKDGCDTANYGVANDAGTLWGYGWGENAGWINFAPAEGGVFIDPQTGEFSGHAWGENIGWINFNGVKTSWRGAPDTDGDGVPDSVDTDDDNDGVLDAADAFPFDATESVDTDGDGTGNNADTDDDNDGVADTSDLDALNPDVCADSDGDACDDCALGTDDFGPLADNMPANDGTDTDGDGLCDAGDPDLDQDGIDNAVDTLPNSPSNDFSDGTTIGNIADRGDQLLAVTDAADTDKGVTIRADQAGGGIPATVSLCGGPSAISLGPGNEVVVTCGSITVEVISGEVDIIFVADDGTSAAARLGAGNSLECDTETLTITAPSTNTETSVIIIDGEEISLDPGDTVSNMVLTLRKAKVSRHHQDFHLKGRMHLPPGVWPDNLSPAGHAQISLAGVGVTDQDVLFQKSGKTGDKWRYKDKKSVYGSIKEFKIDWKRAGFSYNDDERIYIQTLFIGPEETLLCIYTGHITRPFTVAVNETAITYTADNTIETDLAYERRRHGKGKDKEYCEPKHWKSKGRHKKAKKDDRHVHFTLPFSLTPASKMTIAVNGEVNPISVADYYQEGYGRFKLVGNIDPKLLPGGWQSSPAELKLGVSLGEGANMVFGSDRIDDEKGWTQKSHKHWRYK